MDRPRREYNETHGRTSSLPLGLGESFYETTIEHPETHERVSSVSRNSRTEANERAEETLRAGKDIGKGSYYDGDSK